MVVIPGMIRAPSVVMVVVVMPSGVMDVNPYPHSLSAMFIASRAETGEERQKKRVTT
jgi:hypothetical protein